MKKILYLLIFLFTNSLLSQAADKFTLSGHIRDASNGEELINATLFVQELATGNVSNVYGFYSITLPKGDYKISFGYVGFETQTKAINLTADQRLDIDLKTTESLIEEITITAEEVNENVESINMSKIKVDVEAVKKMPALFGEVDIIKAIQLLPGVKSMGEGTSGFYVRGGNADQNLVLLDEAPIYNASHLLGFFSSFNPDAIKDMQLSKGAISSKYGGRLSSVLDIRMKEGNSKHFGGSAGIGTIMSRLSLESPIGENGSLIISGRRSYLDLFAKGYQALRGNTENNDFQFYFYDLNAKGNYRISENDRIFVSGYFGRDVIEEGGDQALAINWGNKTGTVRWNHIFSPRLFSNLTVYSSSYDYRLGFDDEVSDIVWNSNLAETSFKADFTSFLSPKHTLNFGLQTIKHGLQPGDIRIFEQDTISTEFIVENANTLENAIYIASELSIGSATKLQLGIRGSSLHNLGPHTHYTNDENGKVSDTTTYEKNFYNTYYNLEPRIGLKHSFDSKQSIKASYNRTVQYIQQASNGNSATPFDVWFTSSPNVKPQLADQVTLGYFRNFNENTIELSAEVYYKKFTNAIDFKEGAVLLLNKNLEGELKIGTGNAYGIEFMLKKDVGKLTGWLSYTYSKVRKQIDGINNGNWYNAKYDKPHDLSLTLAYELTNRVSFASNFIYASGSPATFPTGRYEYHGTVVPVYSDRNGERLPNYHRLDLSMTLQGKKNKSRKLQSQWVFSIYNAYNRKNAFAINFKQDEVNPNVTYAEKSAIFSIVPSATYNIKF